MKKISLAGSVLIWLVAASLSAQEVRTSIRIEGDTIYAPVRGEERAVGWLARSGDMFMGFDYMYAHSPDGQAIAYIGEVEMGEFGLYLFRVGMSEGLAPYIYGNISGRSQPVWSADGNFVAASIGNRIWILDRESVVARILTEPEEDWLEDIDPEFTEDGEAVFFYRGSTFEFSFSGDLLVTSLDGTVLEVLDEENPKYPGEDLMGEGDSDLVEEDHNPWYDLLWNKATFFAANLESGDFWALLLCFDASYILELIHMMGASSEPINLQIFDALVFNGAVLYEDYGNQVPGLNAIVSVADYGIEEGENRLFFVVRLDDRREVRFAILFDPGTLLFFGAFG